VRVVTLAGVTSIRHLHFKSRLCQFFSDSICGNNVYRIFIMNIFSHLAFCSGETRDFRAVVGVRPEEEQQHLSVWFWA